MVTIAIYKMLPLLNGDFFDVKINDEPIMIEEKLYDLIARDLSESLRVAVLIPVIGFYCMLAVPYVCFGETFLAFLPFAFVLYRTIRIYMMTA